MKPSFFHSLTLRLGLLVLVALVPAVLAAVSLNQDFRQHLRTDELRLVQTQADCLAAQGRELLAGGRQLLGVLRSLPELKQPDAGRVSALLRGVASQSPHHVLSTLYDAKGEPVASSLASAKPGNAADRDWFQSVAQTLDCTQGEYVLSRAAGLPVIVQGCPVLDAAGRLTGALSLGIGFSWFQQFAASLNLPPGSTVCVVDAQGNIHAHFPESTAEHAKNIPDARTVMARVRQGQTVTQELGPDGTPRIYAYSLLSAQPGRELHVRLGVPAAGLLNPAWASARHSALGLLAAAVLGLVAAWFVARSVLAPAGAIREAARRLGAGELSFRIRSRGKGPLTPTADAVDAMAEALEAADQRLRSSEQGLRQCLEHSPQGYFATTAEGLFLEANPALLSLLGYDSLEQLRAEAADSAAISVDPQRHAALLALLRSTGQAAGFELEVFRRDGASVWLSLCARALHGPGGAFQGLQGFASDCTARRQQELELTRLGERHLRVLENQAELILVADAETNAVLYANKAARDNFGPDCLGQPCWKARGGQAQCPNCPRQGLLDERGQPRAAVSFEQYAQGSRTWRLVRLQAIHWVDGRLALLETATDITALKAVQEELRVGGELWQAILEHSPALITVRDHEGRFLLAGKRLEAFWGRPASEACGKISQEIYPPELASLTTKEDRDILETGLPLTRFADIPLSGGRVLTLLSTSFPLPGQTGGPDKVCTIATDISERMGLERELRAAKEAAEAESRAKTEFLGRLSHEIRTPLNAILGFSELAGMAASPRERNQSLDALRESGRALLALVNDILDLACVDSGRIRLERVPFNPRQVVAAALEPLAAQAGQKGLKFTLTIGPDVPELVSGDPARLRQILVHLAGNAVKFTPQGAVDIDLGTVGPDSPPRAKSPSGALLGGVQLLLRVSDTGIGIAEKDQELVFENYAQADSSTTRQFGGSGLGLAISRQLVRFMGGDIWVASAPGAGSSFFATLPFAQATAQTPIGQPGQLPEERPLRILVAEDTLASRLIVEAFLRRLGHSSRHAADGEAALELLRQEAFDLVLMDVEMPLVDGLMACRRLRAGEAGELNRFVPVLAMTAHVLDSYRDKCAEAGMNGFVPKPVSFRQLTDALAGIQAESPPARQMGSQMGSQAGLACDPDANRPDPGELVDLAAALELLGGRRELLAEVAGICLDGLPGQRQALSQALAQGDLTTLARTAHSLKSTLASLGAVPASQAAASLETAVRDGQSALLPGLGAALDSLLTVTETALREALAAFKGPKD